MFARQIFTQRTVTPGLAGLMLLVLAVGGNSETGSVSATPLRAVGSQGGGSCPLTAAQQMNSSKVWLKMMPVFRHPRCLNCHGGIPDPLANWSETAKGSTRHVGVVDIDIQGGGKTCENCHMAGWTMPGGDFNWVNKTAVDLCMTMKQRFNGARFIDHIRREEGGIQFIAAAFRGKRGLDADPGAQAIYEAETGKTFRAEPPPITHAQFIQQAQAWVTAQGGDLVGDDECGCVIPETGEVYLLEIQRNDPRGFPGILVTDSVTMKIRIEDTTVTVFAIINFPSRATPETVKSPQTTIAWIPDPVGLMNIVSATGSIALDFPTDNVRTLLLDFTHSGTRAPEFEQIMPRNVRQKFGGEVQGGDPGGTSFALVPGKKVYAYGAAGGLVVTKLTLLLAPKK